VCLLAEVLLVEVLPPVVLLALVGKVVLVASGLLEKKGKTPPGLEIPEEEGELLLSGALPVLWYLWYSFSFAGWTGEHRYLCFWSLPMRWFADAEKKTCEYQCSRCKRKIGINEKVWQLP